jgi:hypothetical protein
LRWRGFFSGTLLAFQLRLLQPVRSGRTRHAEPDGLVARQEDEYRANLTGLNTFFGTVIGFVLTDVTTANPASFPQLLIFTAAIVIGVLYISASPHRWLYGALNLLFI